MNYPSTPDGRYFVVRDRLWRCSNPDLPEDVRQHLVNQLMDARRAIKAANKANNETMIRQARAEVHAAKVALGERGPVWWKDNAPDLNRHLVKNTPYAEWYETVKHDG